MKKLVASILSVVLFVMLASSVFAAQPVGNLSVTSLSLTYKGKQLVYDTVLSNVGNAAISDIHTFHVQFFDKNKQLITTAAFDNDPQLQSVVLQPGDVKRWTFVVEDAPEADISYYYVKTHAEFINGSKTLGSGTFVMVNGKSASVKVKPYTDQTGTYISVRELANALGAKITINGKAKTITISKGKASVTLKQGVDTKERKGSAYISLHTIHKVFGTNSVAVGKTGSTQVIAIYIQ